MTDTGLSAERGSRQANRSHSRAAHEIFAPFPVAYFAAALVSDLAYSRTAEITWEQFSVWLITGGLVMALAVAAAASIDLLIRGQRPIRLRALGYVAAVLLSLLNVFVHSRDGYTAVVPLGLTLSTIVVIILMSTSFAGWALTSQRRTGADK